MGKYKIKDFTIGDEVYHLSYSELKMVAIDINEDLKEISCRWIDKYNQVQCREFMPEELGKTSDLPPRIQVNYQ